MASTAWLPTSEPGTDRQWSSAAWNPLQIPSQPWLSTGLDLRIIVGALPQLPVVGYPIETRWTGEWDLAEARDATTVDGFSVDGINGIKNQYESHSISEEAVPEMVDESGDVAHWPLSSSRSVIGISQAAQPQQQWQDMRKAIGCDGPAKRDRSDHPFSFSSRADKPIARNNNVRQSVVRPTRQFQCPKCPRSFRHRSDYYRHWRELHGEREDLLSSIRCPHAHCERSRQGFARRWNLNDHHRRCHGGDLPVETGHILPPHGTEPSAIASEASPDHSKAESLEGWPQGENGLGHVVDVDTVLADSLDQSPKRRRQYLANGLSFLKSKRDDINAKIGEMETELATFNGK